MIVGPTHLPSPNRKYGVRLRSIDNINPGDGGWL